jgi:hypothetical protein
MITDKTLKELGACASQVRLFKKTFPNGVNWTKTNVRKAVNAGLNVDWLICRSYDKSKPPPFWKKWRREDHKLVDMYLSEKISYEALCLRSALYYVDLLNAEKKKVKNATKV